MTECRNTASVAGTQSIGGITGAVSYGTISKCINTGSVGTEDKSQQAGGIAGLMSNYAVVEGCYNTGTVIGKKNLGGLAGEATVCAVPQGCYNIGSVASGINTGGSVGAIQDLPISVRQREASTWLNPRQRQRIKQRQALLRQP